jgi:hypothetical protein
VYQDVPVTGLIASVVSQSEPSILTASAIQLADILLIKFPVSKDDMLRIANQLTLLKEIYCILFEREGVLQDIDRLSHLKDTAPDDEAPEKGESSTDEEEGEPAAESVGSSILRQMLRDVSRARHGLSSPSLQLLERLGARFPELLEARLANTLVNTSDIVRHAKRFVNRMEEYKASLECLRGDAIA